jgi:hypothetical protein
MLEDYIFATSSFNLWMVYTTHDVFALVIIFLRKDWKTKTNNYWIV